MACSLELTVGAKSQTILVLSANTIANVLLTSVKQVLAKAKHGCHAWFGLLHPRSLMDTKGVLAELGGGDSTKVPGTDPSHWELIFSELTDVFEKLATLPEKAIKLKIDLLPDFAPPTEG